MDHVSRLVALTAALLGLVGAARAQTSCYQYGDIGGGWHNSAVEAMAGGVAFCNANPGNNSCDNLHCTSAFISLGRVCTFTGTGLSTPALPDAATYTLHVEYTSTPAGHPSGSFDQTRIAVTRVNPDGCPPPEQCSNDSADGVGDVFTSLHFPGVDGYCNPISKCRMSVRSTVAVDGTTVYTIEHTGQQCTNGQQPGPGPTDLTAGENCVTGSGGEFCLTNQGENCGFLNDAFVCLPQIEEDGCEVFGDGGRVCGPQAPTPPVPDNGTRGQPASPDEQILVNQNNATTTYNYFNSTTVSNSARPAGTSGDNPFDGEDDGNGGGTCQGDECGEGEGEASGGDTCDAPPSCSGDPIQCVQLKQQWLQRCPAAVTDAQVDAVLGDNPQIAHEDHDMTTSLSESLVVGGSTACPAPPQISLPTGGTVTITVITSFCELAGKIAPLVIMAAYVAAAFIVAGRL